MAENMSEREKRKRRREARQEELERLSEERQNRRQIERQIEMLVQQRDLLLRQRDKNNEKDSFSDESESEKEEVISDGAEEIILQGLAREQEDEYATEKDSIALSGDESAPEFSCEADVSSFLPEDVFDSTHFSEEKLEKDRKDYSWLPDERIEKLTKSETKLLEEKRRELRRHKELIADIKREMEVEQKAESFLTKDVVEEPTLESMERRRSMKKDTEREIKQSGSMDKEVYRYRECAPKAAKRCYGRLDFDDEETDNDLKSCVSETKKKWLKERQRLERLNRKEEEKLDKVLSEMRESEEVRRRKRKELEALVASISGLQLLEKEVEKKKKRRLQIEKEINTSKEDTRRLEDSIEVMKKKEAELIKKLGGDSRRERETNNASNAETLGARKQLKTEASKMKTDVNEGKLDGERKQQKDVVKAHGSDQIEADKKTFVTFESAVLGRPYLPSFDGKNYDDWKTEVKWMVSSSVYSDATVAQVVRNSLKGQTRKVLTSLPPSTSTEGILEKLDEVYGNIRGTDSMLQEFFSARQFEKESSSDWGLRLENMLQKVIDKGELDREKKEEMLKKRFWKGLKSERLREACRNTYESQSTFAALRRKVREEEEEIELRKGDFEKTKTNLEPRKEQQVLHQPIATNTETEAKLNKILDRMRQLEEEMKNYSAVQQNFLQERGKYRGRGRRGRRSYRNTGYRESGNTASSTVQGSAREQKFEQHSDTKTTKATSEKPLN